MLRNLTFCTILLLLLISCATDPIETRDRFYESGQEYMEQEDYEAASIQFLNALKADGSYGPAQLALAEAYAGMGNHQQAVAQYRAIIEKDPNNSDAKLALGTYYLQAGLGDRTWFEEAQKLAQEILEVEPDNVRARLLLGNSYAGTQDFDNSIQTFQEILETDPDNLEAYLNLGASQFGREDSEAAERAFQEAIKRNPQSAKAFLGLGNFYVFSRQLDKAEEAFRSAFDLEPESPQAALALVRLYMTQAKPDEAEAVFERVIEASSEPIPIQISLVNFLLARGEEERGLNLLRELRLQYPDDRSVAIRLAEVELLGEETDQADGIVEGLLGADDRDAEAHFLKGQLLTKDEQFDAALVEIDRAIELRPRFALAYLAKTDLLQRTNRLAEAEATVREFLELSRDNLLARAKLAKIQAILKKSPTDLENALGEAEAILQVQPVNVDAQVARAEALLGLNRLPEAKSAFEVLTRISPENPFYLHRLGSIAALQGDSQTALDSFRKTLAVNPNLSDVINDITAVHVQQGNFDEALRELDRMSANSEEKWLFHQFKGRVLIAKQDFAAAEVEIRKASDLNPDNYQPYLLLGQLMMTQNRFSEAIAEVDRLLEKNPRFGPAQLLRAYYLDASKDSDGAIEEYRKTLELYNDNEAAYAVAANNLAWLLAEQGLTLNEARTLAQQAREIDPNRPQYADTLGWIYYKMGSYTLAVDQLLFSVNQGNQQPQHYYRLGMAYYKQGDSIHAKQALRRALELGTDFDGAEEARVTLLELG